MTSLHDHYRAAVVRLYEVGAVSAADRFGTRGRDSELDRTPVCVAVMCAVDSVDAARAAKLDAANQARWTAISADQRRRAAEALSVCARVRA